MKLYGFGPSRSLRALWGLKELDADFEFIPCRSRSQLGQDLSGH
jgi:hypothetical protein